MLSISLQISNCTSNCELKDVEREKRHEHFTPEILFSSFHLFAAAAAAARLFSAFFHCSTSSNFFEEKTPEIATPLKSSS